MRVVFMSIACLALAANASGQSEISKELESVVVLEPVVVTGTFIPSGRTQSTLSVTVLTAEQIAAQQADSVISLLRAVPGLHIDQAEGRGSVSSVYMRGGDPNYTLVLIDGVKVNDPTNSRGGSFDFSTLNVDSIERIEIVRGPLSSVYGSDAMAGVINIIIHRGGSGPLNSFTVSGGRFGSYRTLLEMRGRSNRVDYSLSGSTLDAGDPVEGSGFSSKTFHVNFALLLSDDTDLRSVFRYADSHLEAFPDDSGGPVFSEFRDADTRDVRELTAGTEFSTAPLSRWEATLRVGYYDRQEEIDSPGVADGEVRDGIPPNISDNQYRRYDVSLQNQFLVAEGLRFSVGIEAESEAGSSQGSLSFGPVTVPTSFDLERDLWGLTAEAQHRFSEGLLLQTGVRLDFPEAFNSELSPRFEFSSNLPSTNTRLHASWGEGFKLPSFFALGHPIVGASATGENLVPEKSRGLEVEVIQTLREETVDSSVTYFSNQFKNAIDFEEEPVPKLVNRSEITTEGLEGAIRFKAGRSLELSSHLTYLKTDIKGVEETLRNRPKWRGGITVRWRPASSLVVNADALHVGKVPDSYIPKGDRDLEEYTRINLAMTWTASPTWNIFLAIDNLLDTDYEEAIGFPAPGIYPRVGLRARL
ncbi:MAG: TonB-dependent receptor [Nitrospira sp.]|nr:TonB-dependent receptor [Candidatus Manganitrophaceae bacterium]HIL34052.1 TonB-dependent receptor [Candidatus Manganitrophaceae bacterium]